MRKIIFALVSIISFFGYAYNPLAIEFLSPSPQEEWLSENQHIIINLAKSVTMSSGDPVISLHGNQFGNYPFTFHVLNSNQLISIKPSQTFLPGETITVSILINPYDPLVFSFKVREILMDITPILQERSDRNISSLAQPASPQKVTGKIMEINGVGVPSDFPMIEVLKDGPTAPGNLFLGNWGNSHYMMILKNDGTPYFYRKTNEHIRDFKVQRNGFLTRREYGNIQGNVMMDSSFRDIDTINCVGYGTDEHECIISSEGNILLIALDSRKVDMSQLVPNGNTNATVIGNHIQELDKDHNLIFEWRCWDNFDILDAEHENLNAGSIDYVHMNSVDYDFDGNIICSSRHLSECTKINRATGEIMWRLGGVNNQFDFVNDPDQFSYQHDFRPVPGKPNHYTVFDNGNFHQPHYSRAVEYVLDTIAMTATKVWEYRHEPNDYATWWMGNAQRLPNGNTLINWADGSLPKTTEVNEAGEKLYEMGFVDYYHCYRTFRFEWTGKANEPYLISEQGENGINLVFNKFGDTNIDHYRIYADEQNPPETLLKTSDQPFATVYELDNYSQAYIMVTAVDSVGIESAPSNIVEAKVAWIKPGTDQVINGSFDEGDEPWKLVVHSGSAQGFVNSQGQYVVDVIDPSDTYRHIQLFQEPVVLVQNKKYRLEFDARAEKSRVIEPKIEQRSPNWINYSQMGLIGLNTQWKNFTRTFTMYRPTDLNAGIVFDCGKDSVDVFIDNVKLIDLSEPCTHVVEANLSGRDEDGSYDLGLSISGAIMPVVYYIDDHFELVTHQILDTIYNVNNQSRILGVIDASGCYSEVDITPLHTNYQPLLDEEFFTLFPNPVHERLTLRFNELPKDVIVISITSLSGEQIFSTNFTGLDGQKELSINMGFLNSGTYLVTAIDAGNQRELTLKFQYIQ